MMAAALQRLGVLQVVVQLGVLQAAVQLGVLQAVVQLGVLQVVVQLDGSLAVLQRDAVSVVAQAAVHQDTEEAGMEGGQEVLALLRLDTDDPEVSLLLGGAL